MDQDRQIRLVIAPFFFYVSLLSAILLDHQSLKELIGIFGPNSKLVPLIVGIVGFIGVSALPIGFLISTSSIFLLKSLFFFSKHNYCTRLEDEDRARIWPKLDTNLECLNSGKKSNDSIPDRYWKKSVKRQSFLATVSFDHGYLYENAQGIHRWITRAYSAYVTSVNCAVALLSSWIIVAFSRITAPTGWHVTIFSITILLLIGAFLAARDVFEIADFHSHRKYNPKQRPSAN